ncbi:MAG: hypothetical protein IPN29_07990 [Saprospiraceae bacterium]|nr:hypothetical protein [Saprospiraceae bacterium]
MRRHTFFVMMIALMAASCNRGDNGRDANGTFEAREIIVSSEVMGRIISFNSEEGEKLAKGQEVAVIDGSNLLLQKEQLDASVAAVREKQNDAGPRLRYFKNKFNPPVVNLKSWKHRPRFYRLSKNGSPRYLRLKLQPSSRKTMWMER